MKKINILPGICNDYDANAFTGNEGMYGDPQYKHWWQDLDYFKQGGENECRCGDPATNLCNYKTYYNIPGYRNTCPIAGKNGTYATPATLRLYDYDFESKGMKGKVKISSISISYSHHNRGVNVGTGRETDVWGGEFSNVQIVLYKYKPSEGGPKEEINSNFLQNRIPIGNWGTVSTTFQNEIILDTKTEDIAIDIVYFKVENTNPSVIRLRDLNIEMEYTSSDDLVLEMVGSSGDRLITDSHRTRKEEDSCRTSVIQKISCYEKNDPTSFHNDVIRINKDLLPVGVEYKEEDGENCKIFTFRDFSGIESTIGPKEILYYTDTEKRFELKTGFLAVKPTMPSIDIQQTSFVKNMEPEKGLDYLYVHDGCFEYLDMYIDNIQDPSSHYRYPRLAMKGNQVKDPNDENFGKRFYNIMTNLDCGYHTLYFYVDDEKHSEVLIEVVGFELAFNVVEIKSNHGEGFIQNKEQGGYADNCYIRIKRIDNQKLQHKNDEGKEDNEKQYPANILIHNETTNQTYIDVWNLNETKLLDIGTYYSGKRSIKLSWDPGCGEYKNEVYTFDIEPNHRQYYDEFLIRSDETGYIVNSIAIQKADHYNMPIKANDMNRVDSICDILYYGESAMAAVGEVGHAKLYVKNTKDVEINNLYIELSPMKYNAEIGDFESASNEWFRKGLLRNFEENFKFYNRDIIERVDVIGLSTKDDWADSNHSSNEEEEESWASGTNVYIKIRNLPPNYILQMDIPFEGIIKKSIALKFSVFGTEMPLCVDKNEFEKAASYEEITSTHKCIALSVLDLVLNNLTIQKYGSEVKYPDFLDFYSEDFPPCEGIEKSDYQDAAILYGITNIDRTNFTEEDVQWFHAIIENSIELKPVKYKIHGQSFYFNPADPTSLGNLSITQSSYKIRGDNTIVEFIVKNKDTSAVMSGIGLQLYYNGNKQYGDAWKAETDSSGIAKFVLNGTYDNNFIAVRRIASKTSEYNTEVIFFRHSKKQKLPLVNEKLEVLVKEKDKVNDYHIFTSKNGIATFHYTVPKESDRPYTATEIMEKFVKVSYNGSLDYNKSSIGAGIKKEETFITINDIIYRQRIVRNIKYTDTEVVELDETITSEGVIGKDTNIEYIWTDNGTVVEEGVTWNKAIIEFDKIYVVGTLKDSSSKPIQDSKILEVVAKSDGLKHFHNKHGIFPVANGQFLFTYETCAYQDKKVAVTTKFSKLTSSTISNKDTLCIFFNGDSKYEPCIYGDSRIDLIKTDIDQYKSDTYLELVNKYKMFYPGSAGELKFKLTTDIEYYKNFIDLKFELNNELNAFGIVVYYDVHKTNNDDVYNTSLTTYNTIEDNMNMGLVPNSLNRSVYINIRTALNVLAKIKNELVQEGDVNTIYTQVDNGLKPNKEVEIQYNFIDSSKTGEYDLIDMIGAHAGDYTYDKTKNILRWFISSMDAYERANSAIRIKADKLGISDIKIHGYDYMCQPGTPDSYETKLSFVKDSYNADYDYDEANNLYKPKWSESGELISAYYIGADVIWKSYIQDKNTNQFFNALPINFSPSYPDETYTPSPQKYYSSEYKDGIYALYHYRPLFTGKLALKNTFDEITTTSGIFQASESATEEIYIKLNESAIDKEKCNGSYTTDVETYHKIIEAQCRFVDANIRKNDVILAKKGYAALKEKEPSITFTEEQYISRWCFMRMQNKPLQNTKCAITLRIGEDIIFSGTGITNSDGYIYVKYDIGTISSDKTVDVEVAMSESDVYKTKTWTHSIEVH